MVSGYMRAWSGTFHVDQRCSGAVFSAVDEIDSKVAENRGGSPCGNCLGGEWPHEDDTTDRDPEVWLDKLEPRETALKFTEPTWHGPEYVGERGGEYYRWPIGLDAVVGTTVREQIVSDLEDPDIDVEPVDWAETPLVYPEGHVGIDVDGYELVEDYEDLSDVEWSGRGINLLVDPEESNDDAPPAWDYDRLVHDGVITRSEYLVMDVNDVRDLFIQEYGEDPVEVFLREMDDEAVWEDRWDGPDYDELTREQLIHLLEARDEIQEAAENLRGGTDA